MGAFDDGSGSGAVIHVAGYFTQAGGRPANHFSKYAAEAPRVVQQPSSWNNYTAVIRVYDPRSGYGAYSFDLGWRGGYSSRR